MKKFELHMGIAMLIITTIIGVILLLTIQLDLDNVFIILAVTALGYSTSSLYLRSYLQRYQDYHHDKGYDHGLDHKKEIEQYKNIH